MRTLLLTSGVLACALTGFMDGYMNAIIAHDPKAVPPLSIDVR
jgi:hypothetical protein